MHLLLFYIITNKCTVNDKSTRGADKSLARPGKKQDRKDMRDARDSNKIETRFVFKYFFFLQGKVPKEIHGILTETLACFLPGSAKDLSAPLYLSQQCVCVMYSATCFDSFLSPSDSLQSMYC